MISHTTAQFRKLLGWLPKDVQAQAKEAYLKFKENPYHPSLFFKRVHSARPIYSVRISRDYRAVGILREQEIVWFWIGHHSAYSKLLNQQRHV